jgi:hypothetical protein
LPACDRAGSCAEPENDPTVMSRRWFLEHRIGDERVLRLIRKWLKAGVLE